MGSKSIVLLGLFCAVVLLITSEVTARELDETSTYKETAEKSTEQTNGIEDAKYGGGGYPGDGNGGGYGGGPGGGYGGGNGGRGGYCRYRCCRRDYNGVCRRCCSYEGEAMEKGN